MWKTLQKSAKSPYFPIFEEIQGDCECEKGVFSSLKVEIKQYTSKIVFLSISANKKKWTDAKNTKICAKICAKKWKSRQKIEFYLVNCSKKDKFSSFSKVFIKRENTGKNKVSIGKYFRIFGFLKCFFLNFLVKFQQIVFSLN